jgi:beta-galactosidase
VPFDEQEHAKPVEIDPKAKFVTIDLKRHANWDRNEEVFTRGHNMGDVPRGKKTLADVPFELTDAALLLGGHSFAEKKWPAHLSGIAVGTKFTRLHVFHTTHYWSLGKGTRIGCYRLRYEGGDWAELPIVYERDLADWCDAWQPKEGRTRLGWAGRNGYHAIRYYVTTYDNPRPDREVVSIDFISDKASACPCCVAMTIEGR